MPAEGGGRQATKASMSQNVDRERRVPLPLIHGFVDNCTSPGVDRVAGTRGDDYRSVTVRVRSVHNFPSHWWDVLRNHPPAKSANFWQHFLALPVNTRQSTLFETTSRERHVFLPLAFFDIVFYHCDQHGVLRWWKCVVTLEFPDSVNPPVDHPKRQISYWPLTKRFLLILYSRFARSFTSSPLRARTFDYMENAIGSSSIVMEFAFCRSNVFILI